MLILIAQSTQQGNNMTDHTYMPNPSDDLLNHIDEVPSGFVSLGTYIRSDNVHGAILKGSDGSLWFTARNNKSIRVDGRNIKKSTKSSRGSAFTVYLNSDTVEAARAIGDGNVSAGIRKAVAAFNQLPDFMKG
jgi:hypothetical protein